ncbi:MULTISPECIES: metal-dependent hydrolase [Paenibacillus]|uniref:metal-dependent hydrolase n=1 Tax=Paenibacillus TaxID=44249 RepID=UPI001BCB010E|nr:metal-dependent hydrolase [Paenibacillus dendritiformis]
MRGKIHSAAGIVLAETIILSNGKPTWEITVAAVIGSGILALLPDLDHRSSTISRTFPLQFASHGLNLLGFRHRAQMHSLSALLVLGGLMWVYSIQIPWILSVCFFTAYASHIFLDMFNEEGVELFWPLPWRIRFLPGFLAVSSDNHSLLQSFIEWALRMLLMFFTFHLCIRYIAYLPGGDWLNILWNKILSLVPSSIIGWIKF